MNSFLADPHVIIIIAHLLPEHSPPFDLSIRISEFCLLAGNYLCEILEAITSKWLAGYLLKGLPEMVSHICLQYSLVVMFLLAMKQWKPSMTTVNNSPPIRHNPSRMFNKPYPILSRPSFRRNKATWASISKLSTNRTIKKAKKYL